MNNTALAKFIVSLGSLNNYGSTVQQTKQALDLKSAQPLDQDGADVAIFNDAVKGINAIKKIGFNVDGIIAVNQQFDTKSDEQPNWPGHLRNAYYNEDDRIGITVDKNSQTNYIPPEIVTRQDLQAIVDQYTHSQKAETDAWRVFAKLSKLQPFQDGNKRTALIAANAAYNTFEKENYLVLPFNDLDRADFMVALMRYYIATDEIAEQTAFQRMLSVLPKDREVLLHQPIVEKEPDTAPTIKLKPQFRESKK